MFVDACAIVAVIAQEPEAPVYGAAVDAGDNLWTSPLAAWEAVIVLSRPDKLDCAFRASERVVTSWLATKGIELREATSARDVLSYAVAVAEDHGLSRRALSNFDCFHYAYARLAGDSMLTLDERLRATDVETLPRACVP